MKKLTVLLFPLMSVFVWLLMGCSNSDTFVKKSYFSGEYEIKKVIIEVTNRELDISASEDHNVYIDYFDGEKEYLEISVSESKELKVELVLNKDWTDYIGTKISAENRKIKIKIPNHTVFSIEARTTNEDIILKSLSLIEQVNLITNGGNIECQQVNVGEAINLSAKNGNITGSIIGGWDDFQISCTIKKGNCNLPTLKEEGEKSFTAHCNHGDINIEFTKES